MGRRGVMGAVGAVAAVAALGAACSAGAGPSPAVEVAAAAPAPGLVRFASCERFVATARARTMAMVGPWGLGGSAPVFAVPEAAADGGRAADASAAAPAPALREGVDYSGTNLQEAGVDEPDIVKTDGRTVFSISGTSIRATDVSAGAPRALGAGFTPDAMSPTGLILAGDRLVVLGTGATGGGGAMPGSAREGVIADMTMPSVLPVSTVMVELDVSDPANPRPVSRTTVDGDIVGARRTGDTLRVVLSSGPERLPLTSPSDGTGAARRAAVAANRRAVRRAGAGAWLPRLRVRDVAAGTVATRRAVGCDAVSRPTRFAGVGMLTVLTLDVPGDLRVLDSDAVMTDGDLVYASQDALYIATPRWHDPADATTSAIPPRGATLIHKLDTTAPQSTSYAASGAVRGYLLNQFSMSEYQGRLRVASTEEPDWWTAGDGAARPSESRVTVLGQQGGRLVAEGVVSGLGRGERIHSVRFAGDRGYVVTFRQTDPLYALDLSDPAHPAATGALKIPGFSSYLQPVGEDLLVGIGQDATERGVTTGTQVSLFDVSDPATPRRIAHRALDSDWSEAQDDHHAVLWWPARRLLVLPVQSWSRSGARPDVGAVGLDVGRDTGITPLARIRHPDSSVERWSPVRRSLVAGNSLITVSDTGVLASDLSTLAPRGWLAFP